MTIAARDALDAALLDAHDRDDRAELVRLYGAAADRAEAAGDIDRACFFLTHAWVFALEQGVPEAAALHRRLKAAGRAD